MHRHHAVAVRVIAAASALDLLLGAAFGIADHIGTGNGLWFATVTATTVGYGDITPHGWLPHLLAAVIMLSVIPLFGAAFSLFTSGLASARTEEAEDRIKQHAAGLLDAHRQPGTGPELDCLTSKVDDVAAAVRGSDPALIVTEAVEALRTDLSLVLRSVRPLTDPQAAQPPGLVPAVPGSTPARAAPAARRSPRAAKGSPPPEKAPQPEDPPGKDQA